ncbi:MAG: dihydrofolate reductase [Clostridia bacterium]|nr:dihydrofolate reductase [Clostridia bacterium]
MLSIIVTKAANNIIGKDNRKPWALEADDKRFDELTKGKIIILGRKAFEALDKVLPERTYVVMTENRELRFPQENVQIVHSMLELQGYIEDENENFVAGGAMIYNLFMRHVNKLYVTELDRDFAGDSLFPRINEEIWSEVSRSEPAEENGIKYSFVEYVRK